MGRFMVPFADLLNNRTLKGTPQTNQRKQDEPSGSVQLGPVLKAFTEGEAAYSPTAFNITGNGLP